MSRGTYVVLLGLGFGSLQCSMVIHLSMFYKEMRHVDTTRMQKREPATNLMQNRYYLCSWTWTSALRVCAFLQVFLLQTGPQLFQTSTS